MRTELPRRRESTWMAHAFARPMVVGAVCVLLLNDYVLKRTAPGFVSGKLSDVAGLFILPLILVALYELGRRGARRSPRRARRRDVVTAIYVSAIGFTFVKSSALGAQVYSRSLSGLQWPIRHGVALLNGASSPAFDQVSVRSDLTDLLAIPILFATWRVASTALEEARKSEPGDHSTSGQRRPADAM